MTDLTLSLDGHETAVPIDTAIVAGWTGRDTAAVEHHITELAKLGVPRPSHTPLFYRVSTSRLTTAVDIECTPASSGEVEPVLLHHRGQLWLGVGSDHTDRDLERHSVAMSKQLCDKPLARELWPYDEVSARWDELTLRSWVTEDATSESVYQEGTLAAILPVQKLLAQAQPRLTDGTVMFCGTLAARGGIRPARRFRYELGDPRCARTIAGAYATRVVPVVS